jgi:hypothetical protein
VLGIVRPWVRFSALKKVGWVKKTTQRMVFANHNLIKHWYPEYEKNSFNSQNNPVSGHWWLTPIILATQEAEIRRNRVRS